jgi:hypothetical protein
MLGDLLQGKATQEDMKKRFDISIKEKAQE